MLFVNNVRVFAGGSELFGDISFVVNAGERLGLVGRNGSGKTTLLRLLAGRQTPDEGSITLARDKRIGYLQQELVFHGQKTVWEEAEEAFAEIKALQQQLQDLTHQISAATDTGTEHYAQLLNHHHELSEQLNVLGADKLPQQMEKILLGLGFQRTDFGRPAPELSGGWQMRIELARLLLRQPDLLLLDEPTNHLDLESIIWLESFLQRYRGAVILVSHDQAFLDRLTTRTLELYNRRLLDFPYPYSQYVELRKQHQEHLLARKKNQDRQIAQTRQLIDRFRYKATKARFAQSLIKQLERMPRIEIEDEAPELHFTFPEAPRSGHLVFETEDLAIGYENRMLAQQLSFQILRAERIAMVGRNGEGKTTLGRILAGTLPPLSGRLRTGHNVRIGYYAQFQADRLQGDQTVYEFLEHIAPDEQPQRLRNLLGAFLFRGDDIHKKTAVLSGGEKSRLALASLLLQPYNVLILDEPTNHLDMAAKAVLKQALAAFSGTLILVSHDRQFLNGLVNKVFHLSNGQLKQFHGTVAEYLEHQQWKSIDDLERRSATPATPSTKVAAAPAQNIRRKKLQRQIAALEKQIAELEQVIAHLELRFANPDQDLNQQPQVFQHYQQARQQLDEAMKRWTTLMEELEDMMPAKSGKP